MGAHVVGGVEWWMANDVAKEWNDSSALFYEEVVVNGRNILLILCN